MEIKTWNIWIEGYGTYEFQGTLEEVEIEASDKADWEGSYKYLYWDMNNSRENEIYKKMIYFYEHPTVFYKFLDNHYNLWD